MSEYTVVLVAVLLGVAVGIPILLMGFRQTGRSRCWRCHVWMPVSYTHLDVYKRQLPLSAMDIDRLIAERHSR